MRFLFDENLSWKLARRLIDLYPASIHVSDCGMVGRPDSEIWTFARREKLTIISTDADFYGLATALGPPPKVIWLRKWSHPTKDAEIVLRREAVRIAAFDTDAQLGILVLDR